MEVWAKERSHGNQQRCPDWRGMDRESDQGMGVARREDSLFHGQPWRMHPWMGEEGEHAEGWGMSSGTGLLAEAVAFSSSSGKIRTRVPVGRLQEDPLGVYREGQGLSLSQ